MKRIKSYFSGVSVSLILIFTLTPGGGFSVFTDDANAQVACDHWIDYFVSVDGDGTCTVGIGGTDFLSGSGIAKCTFAKNGNINCTCKGNHTLPLSEALIFNRTDQCCISIGADDPIESDITMGLGTPSGIMNATCKVRD